MAEKYLDNSGVSRLLQGVSTFVNNAYKNVFTKMIEVDSYETVDLQPNQIIRITPAVDGPMTINFIAHTKPNAEYELIVDITPNATITYNGNVLWENGEFVPNNVNTVRLKFITFDYGSVYLAEYTLYSLENRLLYYSTTDGSDIGFSSLEYTKVNTPETQIGDEIYTRALLLEGSNVKLGTPGYNNKNVLKSIALPKAVTTIPTDQFYHHTKLRSITIGSGVTTIGDGAFWNCGLTSVTIPDNVTTIEGNPFKYCHSLKEFKGKFAADNGRCLIKDNTIIAYANASGTTYTIPDSVTTIRDYAFAYCDNLTNVTIPDSVTTIGEHAFDSCDYLTSVTIPDSITKIGDYTFNYCSKLTSITIPNSVTEIGSSAFSACHRLASVTIPDSVTSIGDYAFYNCQTLVAVYCKRTTPPAVGRNLFSYSSLTIYVPMELVDVYKSAWSSYAGYIVGYNYNSTTTISYTTSDGVPANASGLIISNNYQNGIGELTYIGKDIIPAGIFSNCNNLTSLTIPDNVIMIENEAFYNCTNLTSITIPDGVTSIGGAAFRYCDSLTRVTIPDSVTSIGDYAFYNCDSLTSVTIGNSVTEIGAAAFQGCSYLESVAIPDGVTLLNANIFSNCDRLTSVIIPDSVTTIAGGAFYNCRNLTSITIPDGVTSIGYQAFYNCYNLTSITIPDSVTTIGDYTFYNCYNLTSITIPDGVTEIGDYTFYNCDFTSITIPNSVTTIGNRAFQGCNSLTSVTIPDSVTSIGDYAFQGCFNLCSIVSYNITAPVISSNSFNGIAQNGTLWCFSNSDYSTWMSTSNYYLGSLGWTINYFEPTNYYNLSITADNVMWNATTAPVQWSCLAGAINPVTNETVVGIVLKGTGVSEQFAQNTSNLDVERTVVFEIFGLSATTTITQYKKGLYTINLNNQWQKSTKIANPDSSVYDGVYESFSNYNVHNTGATMTITINGYSNFILYIRSYAESSYDYVMVSQLDQTITNSSSYSNTTLVKAHTRGNQQSGTAISNYTKVEFENIDEGEHTITIVYRKDSSSHSYDDRGYVLIPKS